MEHAADSDAQLGEQQKKIFNKYSYENYVCSLTSFDATLTRAQILEVERATRGQSENPLWNMLRLDRKTASSTSHSFTEYRGTLPENAALSFGLVQEKLVKMDNKELVRMMADAIERKSGQRVTETVLESGIFFSKYGLHAASPDAYFVLADERIVPLEIKCPITYKDVTIDQMRAGLGVRKERYRVKCTALSVNCRGAPIFAVERTDPHYRQMQRQMYVMDSPFALYLVKFKRGYVVATVPRDPDFYARELASEKRLFNSYVTKNLGSEWLNSQHYRMNTFRHATAAMPEDRIAALARQGIYYSFGELVCAFCHRRFDSECAPEDTEPQHPQCASHPKNEIILRVAHKDYLNIERRVRSMPGTTDSRFARGGLFRDPADLKYKMFCCGLVLDSVMLKHADNCDYVTSKQRRPTGFHVIRR